MTNAKTTKSSRTFGNVITVTWTPSETDSSLLVTISSGGNTLKWLTFDGTSSLTLHVDVPPFKTDGKFSAVFNAGGKTGTLTADEFTWDINGQVGSFKGDIGVW